MSAERNRELLTQWYTALEEGDWQTISDMHADDVVYYMVGTTPVSGKLEGKAECSRRNDQQKTTGPTGPRRSSF